MISKFEAVREVGVLVNSSVAGVCYRRYVDGDKVTYRVWLMAHNCSVLYINDDMQKSLVAEAPTLEEACDKLAEICLNLLTEERDRSMAKWGRAMELLGKKP